MKKWEKLVGKRVASLTLLGVQKHGSKYPGLYECVCGNTTLKDISQVNSGKYKSCGCMNQDYRKQSKTIHGHSRAKGRKESPEYNSWRAMKERCLNVNSKSYKDYGGRGIRVCKRWQVSFAAFLEDMGPKPTPNHSIDRINNDWGYTPSNCWWATRVQQNNNQRPRQLHTV